MKNWVAFLLIVIGTGCGSTAKDVSAQIVASIAPKASRDELLDPDGEWNKHSGHAHVTVALRQLSKWKKIAPEMHTWCVNFKAKECEEYYKEDPKTLGDEFRKEIRHKVDPNCKSSGSAWDDLNNDCAGNFIEYGELEHAEPLWIKGERDPKPRFQYTAEGKWVCPDGFTQYSWLMGMSDEPKVWYVPPKIDCSRAFYWGVWRRSPYAKEGAQ